MFVFDAGRPGKNRHFSRAFLMVKKVHHINHSPNDIAEHVILLLRKREKLWEGRGRKRDSDRDSKFCDI